MASVSVGLVKLVATLFTVFRVDQYGRRYLLFLGTTIMAASLLVIAISMSHRECEEVGTSVKDCDEDDIHLHPNWAYATVVAVMVYTSGYQVGFGPVSWTIISEVFPLRV